MAEDITIQNKNEPVNVTTGGKSIGTITADQLKAVQIPTLDTKPLDVSGLVSGVKTNTAAITSNLLNLAEQEKQNLSKSLSNSGATGSTPQAQMVNLQSQRPVTNTTGFRTEAENSSNITGLTKQSQDQLLIATQARINLENLEAQRNTEYQNIEATTASRSFKNGEKQQVEREYNTKIAQATSKLSAEAALASLYQGNLTDAQNQIDKAVTAYMYDMDSEINRFDKMFDTQSAWIDQLEQDERDALNMAYDELKTEREAVATEKDGIASMMLSYNQYGAGITLDDTMEEALKKAGVGTKEILRREDAAAAVKNSGDLNDSMIEVYSIEALKLMENDTTLSLSDAVGKLPISTTAQANVLYYTSLYQSQQEQAKLENINRINTEEITTDLLNGLLETYSLDDLKAVANDDNTRSKLTETYGKIASSGMQKSAESFGSGVASVTGMFKEDIQGNLDKLKKQTGQDWEYDNFYNFYRNPNTGEFKTNTQIGINNYWNDINEGIISPFLTGFNDYFNND